MRTGTNLGLAAVYNQQVVLEAVRFGGPIPRTELSRGTALSLQTVSNIVGGLLEDGLLEERPSISAGRGRPVVPVAIRAEGAFAVGVHLDRDHLTGVVTDLAGNVHSRVFREISLPCPEEGLTAIATTISRLVEELGQLRGRLRGVGVSLPGPFDRARGTVRNLPNFPGWGDVQVANALEERLGLSVLVENDGTAAAVGERWFGAAREIASFFYVLAGVGLGGGLMVDGRPYRGLNGNAAEIGHLPLGDPAIRCSCGGRGCVEQYFSLGSLSLAYETSGQPMPNGDDAWSADDPILDAWVDRAAPVLARALVCVENLTAPQAIVVGGWLPPFVVDLVLARMEPERTALRMHGMPVELPVLRSTLGSEAASLGAAVLPLFEVVTPSLQGLFKVPARSADRVGQTPAPVSSATSSLAKGKE